MKWLSLAIRNVLRYRRRSAMAIMIAATGTAAVLVAFGYMLATFWGLRETTIRGELGHLQIGLHGQFEGAAETPLQHGLDKKIADGLIDTVGKMPDTKIVLRRTLFEGLIARGGATVAFIGQGVEPEKEARLTGVALPLLQGKPLPHEADPDQMQVLLAVDLARTLKAAPGDWVTILSTTDQGALNGIDALVAGIYQTGVPEYDKRALMIPLPAARILMQSDKISRLVVMLGDTEATDAVAAAIAAADPVLAVMRWIDMAPFYQKVVILYRGIFTVMGAIVLLVVLLSIGNTMMMNVMERVREVGTMLALGIPRRRIRINFLLEGVILGAVGGIFGLISAAAIAKSINAMAIMMPAPPGRTMPVPLLISVDGPLYAILLLLVMILGGIAAWIPTYHIVRLKIVDALGHV